MPNTCECCEEEPAVIRLSATDMDGTILDTEMRCLECAREWSPAYGFFQQSKRNSNQEKK